MSMHSLELMALKKIPAKYRKAPEKIYDAPPRDLDSAYGEAMDLQDSYHITLKIRSRYCSMAELKAWLKANHPELDLEGTWSMTGGYSRIGVTITDAGGNTLHIPYEIYETLETDHVDRQTFECLYESWRLDLGCSDITWMEPLLPRCITDKDILELAKLRIQFAKKSDAGSLEDRLNEADITGRPGPDIIGFLADGLKWARLNRSALYARLVD